MDIFDVVHTTTSLRGKNTVLDRMVSQYNWAREDIVYVGDEIRDIAAAKKSRFRCAAVAWGFNSVKVLKRYKPDYFLNTPWDLTQLLNPPKPRKRRLWQRIVGRIRRRRSKT